MPKIKKEKNFSRKYSPLVLWYEDLEEIFNILNTYSKAPKLANSDYEFDCLSEARDHFKSDPQHKFRLSASAPYTSFRADPMEASLSVSGDERSAHVFLEIDGVLAKAQRKPTILYKQWFLISLLFLLGMSPRFIKEPLWQEVIFGIQAIAVLWFFWVMYLGLRRSAVLHLVSRSEGKGFFKRNKDQLLMMIIGIVLGGLLTFAGTQLKERYLPSTTAISNTK